MAKISVNKMRKRYIAFEIQSDINFQRNQVIRSIQNNCYEIYNQSCKNFDFFLTRFKDNIGILRCFHIDKQRGIDLLKSIEKIDNHPVSINTIGTSGTIKTLIKKHLNGNILKD